MQCMMNCLRTYFCNQKWYNVSKLFSSGDTMARKKNEDDWRRHHKFKEENVKLRREVSKLRKLVKEAYSDRLEERLKRQEDGLEPYKQLCEICGNEDLLDIPINRPDGKFTIRMCNCCDHRGDMKKVT